MVRRGKLEGCLQVAQSIDDAHSDRRWPPTVRHPLRPSPGRLEQDSDRHRCGDRQDGAPLPPDERTDARDHADIDGGERRSEQPVHDGAVDDHVDLVQPVLQDGDRERSRKAEEDDEADGVEEEGRDGRFVASADRQGDEPREQPE